MSLRSRLLLVVLGLVIIGLTATDFVTYRALRSFLLDRVDQQLVAARQPIVTTVFANRPGQPGAVTQTLNLSGAYAAIIDVGGKVVRDTPHDRGVPDLTGIDLSRNSISTVEGIRDSGKFRVQVNSLEDSYLLIAIPLREVTQTLHRLLFIEALATGLIVVIVGGAALVLVRAGLRPLEDIGGVAGAIAKGDLSRRVPIEGERTEVGRLGLSLNAMLGQIQSAFEARRASEDRLRRFVADASHELRTPLTSIRGYAELFRRGAAERPADLEKAMRRIEEEATRMGVLVDDLLLLARLDQGRPLDRAPVDLVRVAADAVDDARATDPDRALSLDGPEHLVIEGDEPRLRQVAVNLVANACQHTPVEAPVVVRVTTSDGQAVLEVADRGAGLEPEAAQKVFERFYRADPSRSRSGGGSGLGLSIVAAIAEAHGGRAIVDSTPGQGACFRVILPFTQRATPTEPGDGLAGSTREPSATESVPVVSSWAAPPPSPRSDGGAGTDAGSAADIE